MGSKEEIKQRVEELQKMYELGFLNDKGKDKLIILMRLLQKENLL